MSEGVAPQLKFELSVVRNRYMSKVKNKLQNSSAEKKKKTNYKLQN